MERYDYIIAGGGCAGLSLALAMQAAGLLRSKRLLLVDREAKERNDRTWCFWGDDQTPFAQLAAHKWDRLNFFSPRGQVQQQLQPYAYYLLRGIDFYRHAYRLLRDEAHITWCYGDIQTIREKGQAAEVVVDGKIWRGDYLFNSSVHLTRPDTARPNVPHFLWQHFKGWTVRSPDPVFQADTGTLMDFRVPQHGSARFGYVLPFSAHEALVEFTVFSPQQLSEHQYDTALRAYLRQQLGVSAYTITETERGAIPMTDRHFPRRSGERIIHIGTAGGAVKPTTGYAFQRIQQDVAGIARSLAQTGVPSPPPPGPARFRFYDTLLLHILEREGSWGRPIFSHLFHRNPMPLILKFLEEKTRWWEEARLFATLPLVPFLRAVWETQVPRPQGQPRLSENANALK